MDSKETSEPWWQIVLLIESALLAIAMVTPVTPSKTGSDRRLAHLFIQDPSYLQEVAFNFLMLHVLLILLAVVVGVSWRFRGNRD